MEPERTYQDEAIEHIHAPKWNYDASSPYEGALTVCEGYPYCQVQFQFVNGDGEEDPQIWTQVPDTGFSRVEFFESLDAINRHLADVIDMAEFHESQMGFDNPGALALTRLREAGAWFLVQQAMSGGTSLQDALRQI